MQLDDERRWEVLQGELVMVPSPNIYHQRSITRLGTIIDAHVVDRGLGETFDAPFDVVLDEENVVQPDFSFVADGRLAELFDGHCISGAPDLVIEVLSPATEGRDRHTKRGIYAKSGIPWLMYVEPEGRLVEVLKLNEEGKYVVEESAVDEDVLTFELFPDLEIDLSEVWFELPEES
jgi:Uma2 family endonuclease